MPAFFIWYSNQWESLDKNSQKKTHHINFISLSTRFKFHPSISYISNFNFNLYNFKSKFIDPLKFIISDMIVQIYFHTHSLPNQHYKHQINVIFNAMQEIECDIFPSFSSLFSMNSLFLYVSSSSSHMQDNKINI